MTIYPRAHWYLMFGLVVAIGGFIPSYWSQEFATFRGIIHVHAATATLWFLTLILQPWLVNSGKRAAHRAFGYASLFNAVVLVVTAAVITPRSLDLQTRNANLPYMFVYWDTVTICLFAVFVILGIKHRRNEQRHARYMVGTVFVPMLPALGRGLFFYGIVENFVSALYLGNALTLAVISLLIYDDHKKGKVHSPYVALYVVFVVLGASMEVVGAAPWWQRFVDAAVVPIIWTPLVVSIVATVGLGSWCTILAKITRNRPRGPIVEHR